jgi:hypothetical protein
MAGNARAPGSLTRATTAGAVGGGDLRAAAEVIAGTARQLAAGHGLHETAAGIEVTASGYAAEISCETPAAYPNETGSRHPVFAQGPDPEKWTWVKGNHRPFLGPAADARAGAAMARYAQKIDRMCRKAGFR